MTIMGEQSSKNFNIFKTNENLDLAIRDGLPWLSKAQLQNEGCCAGSHGVENIRDPHAVKVYPANTAIVAAAFLKSGSTVKNGKYRCCYGSTVFCQLAR